MATIDNYLASKAKAAKSCDGKSQIQGSASSSASDDIKIEVKPLFLDQQSLPQEKHFVWLYKISIHNKGKTAVTLLNRTWHICDTAGKTEEIQSLGLKSDLPLIEPGQTFQYQSGCPLETPSGIMSGYFELRRDDGHCFVVTIPSVSLDSPYQQILVN